MATGSPGGTVTGDEASWAPRPTVAVLVSRFPKVTETFILREVVEMERQGRPVLLAALFRERPPVVHPEARAWLGRVVFAPWRSLRLWTANLRALARRPGRYLGTLARLAAGTVRDPGFLLRSVVLFPKAVYLAERFADAGVAHVHVHFATHPATVAWVVERFTGIPYSVTVHAHDLFVRRAFLEPKLVRARFVRSISAFNKRFLGRRYPGIEESVAVVHVGVDPGRYGAGRRQAPPLHATQGVVTEGDGPQADRGTDPEGKGPHAGRGTVPEGKGLQADRGTGTEGDGPLAVRGPAAESGAGRSLRLLTVAALEPYKGVPVLIEAAERLRRRSATRGDPDVPGAPPPDAAWSGLEGRPRDFIWDVVGEGGMRRRLEDEIRRRGLDGTVRLVGVVPEEEVARRLEEADLFVLPSVVAPDGQMEGIPVALMEALAAGVPVVASDLSGVPELVEDGRTGLLVPPGDAAALATAVERLVRDPELAARLAAAGREWVERAFRLDDTVGRLGELLDRETGPAPLDPELGQAVASGLGAAGLGQCLAGLRRVHDGTDSRVAEVLAAAGTGSGASPREVVVKLHRSRPGVSAPPAERARREAELLERLAAAGAGGPFGIPALLAAPGGLP
ncbi:MAG: glycosyltransferase, partial [Thermoanaerobaculia bacterium]